MLYSPAFTFSSVYSFGFLLRAGLRLEVLRKFRAFLASSAYVACASSYRFVSAAQPPWRNAFSRLASVVKLGCSVVASCANRAFKADGFAAA
ncbi:MAG: DUF1010 domain-containing protein [Burkholderiaceae bacterium]|nr:DUF1010 domain-containing protein [Burkholderiaceae bacterium]